MCPHEGRRIGMSAHAATIERFGGLLRVFDAWTVEVRMDWGVAFPQDRRIGRPIGEIPDSMAAGSPPMLAS